MELSEARTSGKIGSNNFDFSPRLAIRRIRGGICRPCPIELRALELIVILRGQYW